MSAAVQPAPAGTRCYQRRRPEHTLWYRTVQAHFETWLALAVESEETAPPAYVEQAFRRYLECGVLSCGLARAFCKECGHDFLVAFSCQGRAYAEQMNMLSGGLSKARFGIGIKPLTAARAAANSAYCRGFLARRSR